MAIMGLESNRMGAELNDYPIGTPVKNTREPLSANPFERSHANTSMKRVTGKAADLDFTKPPAKLGSSFKGD